MKTPSPSAASPLALSVVALFPGLLGHGGVQEAGRHTAAALDIIARQRGSRARFLSLNDSIGPHTIVTAGREISFEGFSRDKIRFTAAAIRAARSASRGTPGSAPILLAAHPNLALPAAVAHFFSPRCTLAVQSHGIDVWQPLPFLRRRALASAAIVLAPSRDTAGKLASAQRIAQSRIHLLPWPLSSDFFRFAARASDDLPAPPGFPLSPVILTVGRWDSAERYKGADDLLMATAQLRASFPALHLVAVGAGDDLPRLRQLAVNLGIADQVHFFSGLSREALAACYARASVFALPSTGEGFGLVFLEAMAFGKPLVAVAAGGSTDLVEDGVNGLLVPPRDPAKLSAALARLLSEEVLRTELGRRGAARVARLHRFEVFSSALGHILANS
ncbi:MAG: glycosyltransferase family 4 protein [Candidatus Acidiferrales bacterium]